jgi:hypothetical protein
MSRLNLEEMVRPTFMVEVSIGEPREPDDPPAIVITGSYRLRDEEGRCGLALDMLNQGPWAMIYTILYGIATSYLSGEDVYLAVRERGEEGGD